MTTIKSILGCTHYVRDHHHGPSMVHAFAVEECETCGQPCEAANAIGLGINEAQTFLIHAPARLPEQWYDEDTDMCRCDNCPEPEEGTYVDLSVTLGVEVSVEELPAQYGHAFEEAARQAVEDLLSSFDIDVEGFGIVADGGTPWIDTGTDLSDKQAQLDACRKLLDESQARVEELEGKLQTVAGRLTANVEYIVRQ